MAEYLASIFGTEKDKYVNRTCYICEFESWFAKSKRKTRNLRDDVYQYQNVCRYGNGVMRLGDYENVAEFGWLTGRFVVLWLWRGDFLRGMKEARRCSVAMCIFQEEPRAPEIFFQISITKLQWKVAFTVQVEKLNFRLAFRNVTP
jgi:hypothetical protein